MLDNLKKINNFLRIENKNGENMFIRFTDYEAVRKEFMAGLKQFGL